MRVGTDESTHQNSRCFQRRPGRSVSPATGECCRTRRPAQRRHPAGIHWTLCRFLSCCLSHTEPSDTPMGLNRRRSVLRLEWTINRDSAMERTGSHGANSHWAFSAPSRAAYLAAIFQFRNICHGRIVFQTEQPRDYLARWGFSVEHLPRPTRGWLVLINGRTVLYCRPNTTVAICTHAVAPSLVDRALYNDSGLGLSSRLGDRPLLSD